MPLFVIAMSTCKAKKEEVTWATLEVTASAYNSVPSQTDNNPALAAWGDTLSPGMKCIAVSRDLIAIGLKHNTEVKIDGFDGIFLVKDKMHSRWRKRIDIYMGTNVKKAREWGRKKVFIHYVVKKDSINLEPDAK